MQCQNYEICKASFDPLELELLVYVMEFKVVNAGCGLGCMLPNACKMAEYITKNHCIVLSLHTLQV